jgi:hypothetical protein
LQAFGGHTGRHSVIYCSVIAPPIKCGNGGRHDGAALAIALPGCGGPKTYTGYLLCQNCGLKGTCQEDNIDLTEHPELHMLKCMKTPVCILSGFGLAILQDGGKYKFYCFDENGCELALQNIVYVTKKEDNLLVEVRGKMEGDTIAVTSIQEK